MRAKDSGFTTDASLLCPPVTDACGKAVEMQMLCLTFAVPSPLVLVDSMSQLFLHTHLGKEAMPSTEQKGSG